MCIRFGTASWTDKGLIEHGGFYPEGMTDPEELLKFYSSVFNVVEVDSSYYAMPSKRNSELWVERTPDGFAFDVKAYAMFTNHPAETAQLPRRIREMLPDDVSRKPHVYMHDIPPMAMYVAWEMFEAALRPLHDACKLGAVLLQFPKWFVNSPANRDHIVRCRKSIPDYRIAVEFRQDSWMDSEHIEKTIEFLAENEIAYITVDGPQQSTERTPPVCAVTSNALAVVKFHGRDAETWEKRRSADNQPGYIYSEEELAEWVCPIRQMAEQAQEVHVIFNNKSYNYAQTNSRQMMELLR